MAIENLISGAFHVLSSRNLAILFVVYWTVWVLYARFLHPLKKIPGPPLASISRGWMVWQIIRGDMDRTQRDLHAKYGPVVRLAPNEIGCSDPEAIKIIYGIKSGYVKTDFYPVWRNTSLSKYPDHFSNVDEKLHADRRRIVNNVYSLSNVLKSEEYIDKCSELFIRRMDEYADQGTVVDFGMWLQMYNLFST